MHVLAQWQFTEHYNYQHTHSQAVMGD